MSAFTYHIFDSSLTYFSSKLYMTFSHCLLLSRGHTLYSGPGGLSPAHHFASQGIERCPEGYNVADWLLEVASGPESIRSASAFSLNNNTAGLRQRRGERTNLNVEAEENSHEKLVLGSRSNDIIPGVGRGRGGRYATTFLTQFEVLAGREWKNLRRYHLAVLDVVV
jgi:ATP-binding cassette, subfamily G (WHITE), member 2